ncbi:MAG TPA: metalloregulator ArsR/SmtB family transcription factor [Anaerolineales bacterium]|nr:metalloregulator ArsR/SmtB family transcription factor [Anaerolineales bacterium]
MKIQEPEIQISELFKALSQPARIEILLAIGTSEACVCHLEAQLTMRQAYISQQLMALRQAGILETRRDGRYIYYRLADPAVLELISQAAQVLQIPAEKTQRADLEQAMAACPCPHCEPQPAARLIELPIEPRRTSAVSRSRPDRF